jgi:hypothetical protein
MRAGDFTDDVEMGSNSSFATLAFLVVFRVLIKLFFWIDTMFTILFFISISRERLSICRRRAKVFQPCEAQINGTSHTERNWLSRIGGQSAPPSSGEYFNGG